MTNYERIQAMSIKELADFLDSWSYCSDCKRNGNTCFPSFQTEEWLNSEVRRGVELW